MREKQGSIYVWFFDRGYGFLVAGEGRQREKFFLHIAQLTGDPALGALVSFDVKQVKEGPLRTAINAEIVSAKEGAL